MLRRRLVTGPLLIGGLVGVVVLDSMIANRTGVSGTVFAALAAGVLVPLGAIEAARLLRAAGLRADPMATVFAAEAVLLATLAATLFRDSRIAIGVALLGPIVALLTAGVPIVRARRIEGGFTGMAGMIMAALWVGLGVAFWVLVCQIVGGWAAAGLVLVVKAGDIGAYFTGMSLGRRKMIPWLSPGKTIAGGVGALVWGGAAGLGLAAATGIMPLLAGLVGGVVLAAVGAAGDLLESLLKREAGAKDSGTILPGMGGMLDVLDSPLLAGPVAWILVVTAG
ncbi:MAG: hypothetical protein CMJ51_05285 [Planctomycetaceae bacterium]|nr:hypothetical protein [Planctomycetaceae bacterium]